MPQFLGGPGGTLSSWATGAGDWLNPAGSMTPFTGAPGAFGSNIPSPSFGSADTANLLPSSVNPNPVGGTTGFGTDIPARTVGDTGTVGTTMSAPGSADGSSGSLSAPPYGPAPTGGGGAFGTGTGAAPGYGGGLPTSPSLSGPSISAAGPAQQTATQQVLKALFGTQGTDNKAVPGIIGGVSSGIIDLLKYLQQRNIMDPKKLAAMQSQLMGKEAAQLRRGIYPGVTAALQETGNINSPYLASQAYTAAIGPTLADMQMQTLKDEIAAQALAAGMWPDTETALGGFANIANLFG